MATRIMAIAVSIIDDEMAEQLNANAQGLAKMLNQEAPRVKTAQEWQLSLGAIMTVKVIKEALAVAQSRDAGTRSLINSIRDQLDSSADVGETDYMRDAFKQALEVLETNLARPYNPASDKLASDE